MGGLPLGIGLIGCGVISEIYLKRCETFPQIEARAVADLNLDAARKRSEQFGLPAVTVDALLARDDIDIVLNLTVPAAHVPVGLQAVAAGKHVYAEKPLGTSFAEGQRLVAAAAAAGVRVGSAPDTFLGGAHQTARAVIDAGAIGKPVAGTATLMVAGHERWHPNPDFYYSHPGGGPAMDMAPYYITALVNMLGPVKRVVSLASRAQATRTIATGPRTGQTVPVEVDTHIAGVLEFASGALVQIVTSFDVKGHKHTPLEIYGSEGSLIVPDPNWFKGTVELWRGGEWVEQKHSHGHGDDNYRGLGLADMAAAIAEGRPHRASGALALHVLEVIEALHGAAVKGAAVEIASPVERPALFEPGLPVGGDPVKVRLGGHGLAVGPDDPVAFARAHREFGYRAAYCPELPLADAARLREFEAAFAAADVKIAEIGIWRNLMAVEPERRAAHLDRAAEFLAVADEVGAGCAVSYIGTFEPMSDYAPHPENLTDQGFALAVETVRGIIDRVKPRRAKFALEMMQYALPDSIESYEALIKAVDRPAFGVHVDPVNLVMTPRRYWDNALFLKEIFARLGPWIVSCHAKDIRLHHQAALHLDEVPIGDGVMDYSVYLGEIARLPGEVPLMLEHLDGPAYAVARDRVFAVGQKAGIAFD